MDESVAIGRTVKRNDLATASVILDFKEQKVVKASFGGQLADKNWSSVRDYYHKYYPNYIDPIEAAYGQLAAYEADDGPLTEEQIEQIKKSVAEFELPTGDTIAKDELFPDTAANEKQTDRPV